LLKEVSMKESVRALLIFLVFSVAAGIAYPLGITGLARLFFKEKATGSLVTDQGRVVGSALIGQKFTGARYFHGRPSANDYDAANSGGDNFGPANRKYLEEVAGRVKKTRSENGLGPDAPVPADLVLASASGLDPHISPEAALVQAPRVAAARGLEPETLKGLVLSTAEGRYPWEQPRINVLRLNLALDRLQEGKKP
jgi:K+-transporting ATPase ATPase C chain